MWTKCLPRETIQPMEYTLRNSNEIICKHRKLPLQVPGKVYWGIRTICTWHQNFDIIMDACETYARQWAKKEDVELDTLSEWIKSIDDVVKRRIRRLKHSVNKRSVIVPAYNASDNYTCVCKRHYVGILIEECGLNSLPGSPTYRFFCIISVERPHVGPRFLRHT